MSKMYGKLKCVGRGCWGPNRRGTISWRVRSRMTGSAGRWPSQLIEWCMQVCLKCMVNLNVLGGDVGDLIGGGQFLGG